MAFCAFSWYSVIYFSCETNWIVVTYSVLGVVIGESGDNLKCRYFRILCRYYKILPSYNGHSDVIFRKSGQDNHF